MKRIVKLWAIIALLVIVGFSITACGGSDGTVGGSGDADPLINETWFDGYGDILNLNNGEFKLVGFHPPEQLKGTYTGKNCRKLP
jgi:predicted small secreted protein